MRSLDEALEEILLLGLGRELRGRLDLGLQWVFGTRYDGRGESIRRFVLWLRLLVLLVRLLVLMVRLRRRSGSTLMPLWVCQLLPAEK